MKIKDRVQKQHQRNRLCVNLSTLSVIFILLFSYIKIYIIYTYICPLLVITKMITGKTHCFHCFLASVGL